MGRKSIRDIRRRELSQAAFEALMQHGIRGTTLDRVAKIAGVSRGIVLHYFKDKDALFEEVQRTINRVLKDGVLKLFSHASSSEERLYAVVVGNFAPSVFHQEICHAWINLCADVPHNSQSQRIQTVVHARLQSNLRSALKHLVPKESLHASVMILTSLIDGVWVRASLQKDPMSRESGMEQLDQTIIALLKPDAEQKAKLRAARARMEAIADIALDAKFFRER